MQTNYIELDPARLDLPLAPVAAGRASSAVLTIGGDIPDDIGAIAVKVEYNEDGGMYTAAGTRQAGGAYRVYLAPSYFPRQSDTFRYHVIGADAEDNPRWLGSGYLRVFDNPAEGRSPVPEILPANSYAYNPQTRLYHKLVAELNEDGEVTVAVEQEGVEI